MTSAESKFAIPSASRRRVRELAVPTLSQETHAGHFPEYDGGGEAWCSPTSTAMVLGYWGSGSRRPPQLATFPRRAARRRRGRLRRALRVRLELPGRGQLAVQHGVRRDVPRHERLRDAPALARRGRALHRRGHPARRVDQRQAAGLPLQEDQRTSARDPRIHARPAMSSRTTQRSSRTRTRARSTARADFENVWLGGSAGIVYVIYPTASPCPPNVAGLDPNW